MCTDIPLINFSLNKKFQGKILSNYHHKNMRTEQSFMLQFSLIILAIKNIS